MDHTEKQDFSFTQSETAAPSSNSFNFSEYAPGTIVAEGRYQVVATLGHGASGCVYEVEHVYMKKRLALKVLLSTDASESTTRRFQKEAQAASHLDHPNLVHAVDFGLIDGKQPYLVMDLVRGITLANYLKENGPLSLEMATETFIPVCLALDYAHREGVIHRDLKPTNIILERAPGRPNGFIPKIVDFGIAKVDLLEETALTKIGEVLGTPLYMSPEQCAGESVDFKSDIYSLGCVIFESLTGTPPFSGKTSLVTMMMHRSEAPPAMKEASMGVEFPRSFESMMAKMLAKEKNNRYSSCMAIAQDFEYLKRGEFQKVIAAPPVRARDIKPEKFTKGLMILGIAIVVSLILVAGLLIALLGNTNSSNVVVPSSPPAVAKDPAQRDAQFDIYHFADVTEGGFSHYSKTERVYTFPDKDAVGILYWWSPGASKPGEHLALNSFSTPINAKPIFDLGWTVIDHNAAYLRGFDDNLLYGAVVNIRAGWTVWGNDDCLKRSLKLLERQAGTLKILWLESLQTKDFAFTSEQYNSINKLNRVQWLGVKRAVMSGQEITNLNIFSHLKILALREVTGCDVVIQKLNQCKSLTRLSVLDCKLGEEDYKALSRNRTLHMLELRHIRLTQVNQLSTREIMTCVSKIPDLERLSIDSWALNDAEGIKCLSRLKKLKIIAISFDDQVKPELVAAVQELLPRCQVTTLDSKNKNVQEWCDPLKTNPGDVISWN